MKLAVVMLLFGFSSFSHASNWVVRSDLEIPAQTSSTSVLGISNLGPTSNGKGTVTCQIWYSAKNFSRTIKKDSEFTLKSFSKIDWDNPTFNDYYTSAQRVNGPLEAKNLKELKAELLKKYGVTFTPENFKNSVEYFYQIKSVDSGSVYSVQCWAWPKISSQSVLDLLGQYGSFIPDAKM